MSLNVDPPSVLTCQRIVQELPLAAAVNLAVAPDVSARLTGCVPIAGGAGAFRVVKIQLAPTPLLSFHPPTMAVVPSLESPAEKPC